MRPGLLWWSLATAKRIECTQYPSKKGNMHTARSTPSNVTQQWLRPYRVPYLSSSGDLEKRCPRDASREVWERWCLRGAPERCLRVAPELPYRGAPEVPERCPRGASEVPERCPRGAPEVPQSASLEMLTREEQVQDKGSKSKGSGRGDWQVLSIGTIYIILYIYYTYYIYMCVF